MGVVQESSSRKQLIKYNLSLYKRCYQCLLSLMPSRGQGMVNCGHVPAFVMFGQPILTFRMLVYTNLFDNMAKKRFSNVFTNTYRHFRLWLHIPFLRTLLPSERICKAGASETVKMQSTQG